MQKHVTAALKHLFLHKAVLSNLKVYAFLPQKSFKRTGSMFNSRSLPWSRKSDLAVPLVAEPSSRDFQNQDVPISVVGYQRFDTFMVTCLGGVLYEMILFSYSYAKLVL